MRVFVTVGSTRFDPLVEAVFRNDVLSILKAKGYSELVVQCGISTLDMTSPLQSQHDSVVLERHGVHIDLWRFKASLHEDFQAADLVISHAGSGTILDVLRMGKPLIVVPNASLLDNHQEELAIALKGLGHLEAATIQNLGEVIQNFDPGTLKPFPAFDGTKFQRILDEEMGFI